MLCCPANASAIEAALRKALTPEFAAQAKQTVSPYDGGPTAEKLVGILLNFDFSRPKTFYDAT